MVWITDSTVFNVNADCIVNTVNCVGFMGKGIALEFALRYPKLEEQYVEQCKAHKIHTGTLYFYNIDGQKIINFPTKFHFKNPSQIEWIEQGLRYFVDNYKRWGIKSAAFPLLGANNGGLDPKEVEDLMVKCLNFLDIDIYICHSKLLEGKELEMVNEFKETSIEEIKDHVRLNSKQKTMLKNNQTKINRFIDISNIQSIGIETYKSLFRLFYFGQNQSAQLSLFDA